jgi:hypothetical protein
VSGKTRAAIDEYGDSEQLDDILEKDAHALSKALDQLLPEFSPTRTLPASMFGNLTIETQIDAVLQSVPIVAMMSLIQKWSNSPCTASSRRTLLVLRHGNPDQQGCKGID